MPWLVGGGSVSSLFAFLHAFSWLFDWHFKIENDCLQPIGSTDREFWICVIGSVSGVRSIVRSCTTTSWNFDEVPSCVSAIFSSHKIQVRYKIRMYDSENASTGFPIHWVETRMEAPDNHCNTVALEAKNDVCTDKIQDFQYIGWRQEWKYQITTVIL
jgi:hypothetical protein